MSSQLDIENVVSTLALSYVTPDYPIYRVKYLYSYDGFDDDDQPIPCSETKVDIMEVRDDGVYANVNKIHINPRESKYISKQMVEEFQEKGFAEEAPCIKILSLKLLAS